MSRLLTYEFGKVVTPRHPFLEADSTPGPQCGRKKLSMKHPDIFGNQNRDLSACNAVPHITAECRYMGINIFRRDICHEQCLLSNNRYVRLFRILWEEENQLDATQCLLNL